MIRLLLIVVLLAAVPGAGLSAAGDTTSPRRSESPAVELTDGWQYRLGDSPVDADGTPVWLDEQTGWTDIARFVTPPDPGDHHFVSLALEGKTCNRDAIGARVELVTEDRPDDVLIRTLHAGEGFLGQSSKRIHFGLGTCEQIARVTVRWPGGEAEDFEGVVANHFQWLVQGAGRAQLWTPPRRAYVRPRETTPLSTPRDTGNSSRTW